MAKYKLSIEELECPIIMGFGIHSSNGPLNLCFELNKLSPIFRFKRFKEDLYEDYRNNRFFYSVYSIPDPVRDIDWKLIQNRSYKSESKGNQGVDLFAGQTKAEKNWINNREGFNFFLWFEGEIQNVSFLHEVREVLKNPKDIGLLKELKPSELDKINKNIKYYHGL